MHDVAPVAPAIALHHVHQREGCVLALDVRPGTGAFPKLGRDGGQHKGAKRKGEQRVHVPHTGHPQNHPNQQADAHGDGEVAPQIACSRLAPRDHRPDAEQRQEQQPDGNVDPVEEGRTDADLLPGEAFRDQREHGPPQDGEHRPDKEQIVADEGGFPRNKRLQTVFTLQPITTPPHQPGREQDQEREEAQEDPGNGQVLRERVHRLD